MTDRATATVAPVCTGYAQPVQKKRATKYGPHDPANDPPNTLTVKCAGRYPLCGGGPGHPRVGTHMVTLTVPPGAAQLRERLNTLAWIASNPEDDMAKKAAHEELTYLSGYCNPTNPLWSHGRCSGSFRDKLCRCDMEGCHCNNARLERLAATTAPKTVAAAVAHMGEHGRATTMSLEEALALQQAANPVTPGTSWTADEVAELMVELETCPLCNSAWDAHGFTDDDRVTCTPTLED